MSEEVERGSETPLRACPGQLAPGPVLPIWDGSGFAPLDLPGANCVSVLGRCVERHWR